MVNFAQGWISSLAGGAQSMCFAYWHSSTVRRRTWIVAAAVMVTAYALGVLGYVLATPEIGIRCAFTRVVNHAYPEFLYGPKEAAMKSGDVIVQIGSHKVETWAQLLRQMARLPFAEPQDSEGLTADELVEGHGGEYVNLADVDGMRLVRVFYERDGKRDAVWCKLGPAPVETLVPSVLWLFLKVGLFAVGAIVFWTRPDDRPAGQFFLLCIVSFGAFLGGYHWWRIATQPALIIAFIACGVMLPAVTLHFYLVFPRPKAILARRWVLPVIYGLPGGFLFFLLMAYMAVRANYPGSGADPAIEQGLLQLMLTSIYFFFVVGATWYALTVAALLHSYRTADTTVERHQVRWILMGSALAAVPIGYALYLAVWDSASFGGGGATWPMFAASASITVAYTVSITRYRLMQLDQLLSSSAGYFLISVLAGLLYYAVVFAGLLIVGSSLGGGPSVGQVLAVSSTALLLMAILDMVRSRVTALLDRHLRREKSQLDRTLQRMSQAIEKLVDPPALARRLLHSAAELLSIQGGAVYLRQGEAGVYRLADTLTEAPPLIELSQGCPLVEAVRDHGTFVLTGSPGPDTRQLSFLGGAAAQGILHEGQLLGILVLGPRQGGAYDEEDLHLLAAFSQVTALALVSAEGHRAIESLNAELRAKVDKIAEQQRRILALQSQLSKRDAARGEPSPPEEEASPQGLVGSGAAMAGLAALARRVAASGSAVLLRGESGTGKEVMARLLHESSPRAGKAFIKVHCAALSPTLLESELFGHVKGAFTSAVRDKMGRFEAADGGTLFLDEIGDISLDVQTKLLRVLEEMSFERVGSIDPVQVDVRIIAATHRDLEAMIHDGRFREDLFFRLNVISIPLPPLRDRVEDIPELVSHFLTVYGLKMGKRGLTMDDDALAKLKGYRWPGNIRELENVIERAVVVCDGPSVTLADLPDEVRPATQDGNWRLTTLAEEAAGVHAERHGRELREKERLVRALAAAEGNKAEAARALGWARSTLVSRLKKFGLS